MKNKINWLNHFIEFVVVIMGILIAFQLNQCSNERGQKKMVDVHLNEIYEETKFNQYNIQQAILHSESNLAKVDSAFKFIQAEGPLWQINKLSLELLNLGGLYVKKNAYSSLIESGDIRHLKDFEDKKGIVDLYEYYKWVEAFDQIRLDNFNKDFYPYIKDNFDLVGGSLQKEEVYLSKIYLNILATYRYATVNSISKYKDCLKEMEEYLAEQKHHEET